MTTTGTRGSGIVLSWPLLPERCAANPPCDAVHHPMPQPLVVFHNQVQIVQSTLTCMTCRVSDLPFRGPALTNCWCHMLIVPTCGENQ